MAGEALRICDAYRPQGERAGFIAGARSRSVFGDWATPRTAPPDPEPIRQFGTGVTKAGRSKDASRGGHALLAYSAVLTKEYRICLSKN